MFEEYPEILTVEELQKMLKVGRNVAYRLVRSGTISSLRIGPQYKILKHDVICYLGRPDSTHEPQK